MEYVVTEIQNGCHLAMLSRINSKFSSTVITVVHNPTRFCDSCLKTFYTILFTDKQTGRRRRSHCLSVGGNKYITTSLVYSDRHQYITITNCFWCNQWRRQQFSFGVYSPGCLEDGPTRVQLGSEAVYRHCLHILTAETINI